MLSHTQARIQLCGSEMRGVRNLRQRSSAVGPPLTPVLTSALNGACTLRCSPKFPPACVRFAEPWCTPPCVLTPLSLVAPCRGWWVVAACSATSINTTMPAAPPHLSNFRFRAAPAAPCRALLSSLALAAPIPARRLCEVRASNWNDKIQTCVPCEHPLVLLETCRQSVAQPPFEPQ